MTLLEKELAYVISYIDQADALQLLHSRASSAVISAVIFLGDNFGFVNAIGLIVLVFGAGLFNYSKYQKLVEKETADMGTAGEHCYHTNFQLVPLLLSVHIDDLSPRADRVENKHSKSKAVSL